MKNERSNFNNSVQTQNMHYSLMLYLCTLGNDYLFFMKLKKRLFDIISIQNASIHSYLLSL